MCIISGAVALATSLGTLLGIGAAGAGAAAAAGGAAVGAGLGVAGTAGALGTAGVGLGIAGAGGAAAAAGGLFGTGVTLLGELSMLGLIGGAASSIATGSTSIVQQKAAEEIQEQQYDNAIEAAKAERDAQTEQARMQLKQQQGDIRLKDFENQQQILEERARVGAALSGLGAAGTSFERVFTSQEMKAGIREQQLEEQQRRAQTRFGLVSQGIQGRAASQISGLPKPIKSSGFDNTVKLLGYGTRGAQSGLRAGLGVNTALGALRFA